MLVSLPGRRRSLASALLRLASSSDLSLSGPPTFASAASNGLSPYKPHDFESTNIVRKKGQDVLHDPLVRDDKSYRKLEYSLRIPLTDLSSR